MVIRVKDILNLPGALQNELEMRSEMKAQALAHRLANKIAGVNMPTNPNNWNPYNQESSPTHEADEDRGSTGSQNRNWGRNGW
jgi:hypothetical protein